MAGVSPAIPTFRLLSFWVCSRHGCHYKIELRHFGTLWRFSYGKPKKSAAVGQKTCYFSHLMAILKKNAFSRRVPDLVTEELVAVLSRRSSFEFKQLFDIVHENLRARNAASGGEEMLRLRAYEKLQNLVARGAVKKNGKKYKGLPSALAATIAQQNGHLAGVK
jgi:hypothetical protein